MTIKTSALFLALLLPSLATAFRAPCIISYGCKKAANVRHLSRQATRNSASVIGQKKSLSTRIYSQNMELDNDEPLSLMFRRGVVLQRSGELDQALKEYDLFLKAAQQCDVDAYKYAEVHVNMGAIHLRQKAPEQAKYHFGEALKHRQLGTAHVNLAVLTLQEASSSTSPQRGLDCVNNARNHCVEAIRLFEDEGGQEAGAGAAARLLGDIDKMLQQANNRGR